jgi:hypothetical protein
MSFPFGHKTRGDSNVRETVFASVLAAGLVVPALAEDDGTIKLHSGWKLIQERVDRGVAYGTLWGVTSTTLAAVLCTWHLLLGLIILRKRGVTWGNGDDQLKGPFSITVTPDGKATGENRVRGTGKLAGVTGGPFVCAFVSVKPEDQQA